MEAADTIESSSTAKAAVEADDQVTEIKEEEYSVVGGGFFRHIGRFGSWASTSAKQRLEQGVSHAVNATLEVGKTARQSVGSVIQLGRGGAEKDGQYPDPNDTWEREQRKRMQARMARVDAFLLGQLEPFHEREETHSQKAFRLSRVALNVAKGAASVVPMGAYIPMMIRATDLGLRFGPWGLGAWILRKDMQEAVNVILRLVGSVPGVSMSDLAGGLYYLFISRKGERGCKPDMGLEEHAECEDVSEVTLQKYLDLGPAALHFAYQSEGDFQRGLQMRGHDVLLAEMSEQKEQVAFFLSANARSKEVLLTLRGTHSIQDMLTDVNAFSRPFTALNSQGEAVNGFAHSGIAAAAEWLFAQVSPCLAALHSEKFNITLTGHSMGGAVAALLTMMLKMSMPHINCYAYAPPPCASPDLCKACKEYIHGVVYNDDIVSRLSIQNVAALVDELAMCSQWHSTVGDDVRAVMRRYVVELGAPRIRRRQCAQSQEKLESLDKGSCEVPLEKSPFEYMSVKTIPFAVVTELVVDAQNNYVHVHLKPGLDMSESTANSMIPGSSAVLERGFEVRPAVTSRDDITWKSKVVVTLRVEQTDVLTGPAGEAELETVRVELRALAHNADLYVPGRLIHIYKWRELHKAAVVEHDFSALSRLELFTNLLSDHRGGQLFQGLQETVNAMHAKEEPPAWISYRQVDACMLCKSDFGWDANLGNNDALQKMRHRHHCSACGNVVCSSCSGKTSTLPRIGIMLTPTRVCDSCFWGWRGMPV